MADSESDLETDRLELALDTLCDRHCSNASSLNSKGYCSEFCELVEEYTGQWQVPLPQLKVLRTALSSFTKATAAFPDDCQHIHYVLSSMALSFFELMLFFSKEEFVEEPLKDILDSFQECHSQLLRHRNVYLQHVKLIIKAGGPWENLVLQAILKEGDLPLKDVEDYLSSELPVFFELRIRYLQACERMQEAMALSKSCLENREAGKHLYFHQAYLTCLYKASLHEHLHKEMAEIDGRDAVEIICNTESVEKDELLLSLCKAFLTQQLHNGDMYYIWDLVFIWSRLHLRAHPSRHGFLDECLQLASSATNVRAIFPFIKLVTTELGVEGVQVCVELCARALQLGDLQADSVTLSLVCKTIAFLLPHDLEICRACALLVFCQERTLEAYRTVCLLYMHPDQEPHPQNSPVRTNVRFHILQMLKERLCFDPEFWNLLTLRTHCLELISDKVMKAAVLSEMKEEEEKEFSEELLINTCVNDSCTQGFNSCQCTVDWETETCAAPPNNALLKRTKWRKRIRRRNQSKSDDDCGDDPEYKYNLKSNSYGNKPVYSLRRIHANIDNSAVAKAPLNRKREYLSRCVKSQILNRKKRWLHGLPRLEQVQTVTEKVQEKVIWKGKKRGRKPLQKMELSFPDNEICLTEEESGFEEITDTEERELDMPHLENELEQKSEPKENQFEQMDNLERENELEKHPDLISSSNLNEQTQRESREQFCEGLPDEPPAAAPSVEADPELDGPLLMLSDWSIEMLHNYSLKKPDGMKLQPPEYFAQEEVNGTWQEPRPTGKTEMSLTEVKANITWKDKLLRTRRYSHLIHHCNVCRKDYKGLNVMRHALSHLNKKLKCILCGKHFKQLPFAKQHILDHIDEMSKQKHPDKEPCAEDIPAANGTVDHVKPPKEVDKPPKEVDKPLKEVDKPLKEMDMPPKEVDKPPKEMDKPPKENPTSIVVEETPEPKPVGKTKMSSLKREDRIIRNLRILIKKSSVLHKRCKNPDANIFKLVEFKDEQVVIKGDTVTVRDPSVVEKPAGENGYGVDTYQLCPSESCDKVFLRSNATLTKHAIKCHISEDKVLEKTFLWTKHKCTLCFRPLQFLQHYKDHMKLHDTSLQHFCYHLECDQRFATTQDLKDHVNTHQPFRPQCSVTDCERLFSNVQGLYDHEWRHYIPAPQREELELGPSRQKKQNPEAPWKQRVKVEDMWLQNKKGRRESPGLDHAEASNPEGLGEMCKTEEQPCRVNVPDTNQDPSKPHNFSENTVSHEPTDNCKAAINGHKLLEGKISTSHGAPETPSKSCRKKPPIEWDPLNVRELEELSTLSEGVQKTLGEPHITEHKTFKPEDPAYATFVKAPFIRPPPSTYLDESRLSMRKRRSNEEPAPKKNVPWGNKKNKELDPDKQSGDSVTSGQKVRHRCGKCLSSFSSLEEFQKHQALNTCSSLFGFDSDDES